MRFGQQKSKALNDYAASARVGDVDETIIPLLDLINGMDDFYTTSSCGGRIALLEERGGKGLNRFIVKWHRRVAVEQVSAALASCSGEVWFRQEPPILHVVARTLENADWMLHEAREAGFKRSGLQSMGEGRNVLEIVSTESINAPVASGGKCVVPEDYLALLVEEANARLEEAAAKVRRLEGRLARALK